MDVGKFLWKIRWIFFSTLLQQCHRFTYAWSSLADIPLNENYPLSKPVMNIPKKLIEQNIYSKSQLSGNEVHFYPANVDNILPFALNSKGDIILKKSLDREIICTAPDLNIKQSSSQDQCVPSVKECCKLLHFQATEERVSDETRNFYVRIFIIDENDNTPTFPNDYATTHISISEDAVVNSTYLLPRAEDNDIGDNTVNSYSIERWLTTGGEHFQLMIKRESNTLIPSLRLMKSLDREKTSNFIFILRAIDNEKREIGLTGSTTITILVLDVNDNSPTFDKSLYIVTVKEHAPRETAILQYEVTDEDESSNGQVFVRIQDEQEKPMHLFQAIPDSRRPNVGHVILLGNLDYENDGHQIKFHLVATDQGRPSLSTTASVVVNIENVNDYAPEIHFMRRGVALDSFIQLREGSWSVNRIIAQIHVSDKDSPIRQLTCRQVSEKEHFRIEKSNLIDNGGQSLMNYIQYSIICTNELDRELKDSLFLTVECNDDDAMLPLKTNATIRIHISDINDNAPIFTRRHYLGTIEENMAHSVVQMLGTSIAAHDADIGQNALLSYAILTKKEEEAWRGRLNTSFTNNTSNMVEYSSDKDDGEAFHIDSRTAQLRTKRGLDYEKKSEYNFMIRVTDGGGNIAAVDSQDNGPFLSDYAHVKVTVIDVNDCPPVMKQSHYLFTVREDASIGTVIGQLEATDEDTDEKNRALAFTMRDIEKPHVLRYISLDKYSGVIKVKSQLDYETQATMSFIVVVQNSSPLQLSQSSLEEQGNGKMFSEEATVVIAVQNVNDNRPTFQPVSQGGVTSSIIYLTEDSSHRVPLCEPIPYRVVDKDMSGQDGGQPLDGRINLSNNGECCELFLKDSHESLFQLMQGAESMLCLVKSPPESRTYDLLLVALDRGDNLNFTAQVHLTVVVKKKAAFSEDSRNSVRNDESDAGRGNPSHRKGQDNNRGYSGSDARQAAIIVVLACVAVIISIVLIVTIVILKRCAVRNTLDGFRYGVKRNLPAASNAPNATNNNMGPVAGGTMKTNEEWSLLTKAERRMQTPLSQSRLSLDPCVYPIDYSTRAATMNYERATNNKNLNYKYPSLEETTDDEYRELCDTLTTGLNTNSMYNQPTTAIYHIINHADMLRNNSMNYAPPLDAMGNAASAALYQTTTQVRDSSPFAMVVDPMKNYDSPREASHTGKLSKLTQFHENIEDTKSSSASKESILENGLPSTKGNPYFQTSFV